MRSVNAPRRPHLSRAVKSEADPLPELRDQIDAELGNILGVHDELSMQRTVVALRALRAIREAREARDLDVLESAIPLRADSPWDELIGPFYSVAALAKRLGVTRQAIHDRISRGTLLATTTADNNIVVPAFQLDAHNTSLPRLKELRSILQNVAPDSWALALWLNTSVSGELDGLTPAAALRNPGLEGDVLQLARHDASLVAQ